MAKTVWLSFNGPVKEFRRQLQASVLMDSKFCGVSYEFTTWRGHHLWRRIGDRRGR